MTQPDKDSVERFDPIFEPDNAPTMQSSRSGEWMRASDYEALQSSVDALEQRNADLRRERDVSASAMVRNHIRSEMIKSERDAATKERDAALAASGAAAAEMRENAASQAMNCYPHEQAEWDQSYIPNAIRAIPLPADAQAALDRALDEELEKAAKRVEMRDHAEGERQTDFDRGYDQACDENAAMIRALKRQPGKGE